MKPTPSAELLAREKKVDMKLYKVIYDLLDEVKSRLESELGDEIISTDLGELEVLAIFKQKSDMTVAGGKVKKGRVLVNTKAQVIRKGVDLGFGEIKTVKVGKENVNDVAQGNECGVEFVGRIPVEKGDILRIYTEEHKAKVIS